MKSLRDSNPLIDSDLDLIINTFEKGMVHSRDMDSVFAQFQRHLHTMKGYPESIKESIDNLPLDVGAEENNISDENIPQFQAPMVLAPFDTDKALSEDEDVSNEEVDDFRKKVSEWFADCVPCTGEFKRSFSAFDVEFFEDLDVSWNKAIKKIKKNLLDFDKFLTDVDITPVFCDLAGVLKGHCGPDIKKMISVLGLMLKRMEFEFSLSLGSVDSYLNGLLTPIVNLMASNLDLISDLALDPLKCVLDQIDFQIRNQQAIAEQARENIIDPIRQQVNERRARFLVARRINEEEEIARRNNRTRREDNSTRSESEIAAERMRLEEEYRTLRRENTRRMSSALAQGNSAFNSTKNAVSELSRLSVYLHRGQSYIENKKDWLFDLIEEFVNEELDEWNDAMGFSGSKVDILKLISVIKAIVEAIDGGDLTCGPNTEGLTEEDAITILRFWAHPAESLEIVIEDGNIVTRRNPEIIPNDDSIIAGGGSGPDSRASAPENTVIRRPISSCLNKITVDEAEQVNLWIRQLEQEV